MKKMLIVAMVIVMLLFTTACIVSLNGFGNNVEVDLSRSNGEVVSADYEISAADAVEIDGYGVVHFVQGDTPSLRIEAEQGYLDDLEVRVVSNRLVVRPEGRWFSAYLPSTTPQYYLTLPNLEELILSGAVRFEADELTADELTILCNGGNDLEVQTITADSLTLKAAGAANWALNELFVDEIKVDIAGMTNMTVADMQAVSFDLEIAGAGSATVAGSVDTQVVEISGTGAYQAGDLKSRDATMIVSGASAITVWAVDDLHLDCDGAGKIDYYGSPRVTQDNAGLTAITSLGDKE